MRSDSPASRMSSPRRSDNQQVFQMSTTSMEMSRDSLKDEPPMLISAPPPVVTVKPKPAEKPQPSTSKAASSKPITTEYCPSGTVVEAMSPSVAESIRSVFAAFIWHAGVVQDGMACASFLKHNTGLTKRGSTSMTKSKNIANEKTSRESKAKQRHSVEVISTAYLNYKEVEMAEKSAANANANRNVTKYLADISGGIIDAIPEDSESKEKDEEVDLNPVPGLPATLGQLVLLWEGVVLSCLDAIMEQNSATSWNKEKNKGNQSNNKSRNQGNNIEAIWSSGNNKEISEKNQAANDGNRLGQSNNIVGAGAGIYQMCDICQGYFEHPVTYHMRMSHPGCGGHAGNLINDVFNNCNLNIS